MNGKRVRLLLTAVASLSLLLLLQPVALADITVQLTLTDTPSGAAYGIYTSPYEFTVGTEPGQMLVCDDFSDEVYSGESWTATVVKADDSNTWGGAATWGAALANTREAYWVSADWASQNSNTKPSESVLEALLVADYNAKAYLQLELASDVALYSYAIWDVFQDQQVQAHFTSGSSDQAFLTEVTDAVADARKYASSNEAQLENLTIYTPTSAQGGSVDPTAAGWEQDYDTVPESSSLPALALDLFALFGGIFLVRKRVQA